MPHPKANTSLKAIAIGLAMAFAACKEKPTDPDLLYDRAALAEQIANELVQPGYDSLATRLDGLGQATAAFSAQLDSASLGAAQTALRNAWEQWNRVSAFEFGPGATHALRQTMNTFPCDANQVNQNVLAGTWDLNTATNIDARGFPALDYLLHGLGATQAEIIAAYTTAASATQRKAYLLAVVDDLKTNIATVQTEWDSYAASFKGLVGTDAGSATSLFLNQLNYDLEVLKNARIGIPLGKTTLGTPVPANVEARYGGYSAALAKVQLRALHDLYLGKSAAGFDGYGLFEALDAVEAKYDGQPLSTAISTQFTAAIAALDAVPDPLDQTVVNAPASANTAYTELQRLIVLTKTDMASNLGILITYNDNDGD